MNWLSHHHLFYFWITANEGSIKKASKKLRIGQPTISTKIKNLEESLEQKLFHRKNRTLVLTEAGKAVLECASQIIALGDELLEVVKDGTYSTRVHVQFEVLDSVPKHLAGVATKHRVMSLRHSLFLFADELFDVAPAAVFLGRKDVIPVVAFPAVFALIKCFHRHFSIGVCVTFSFLKNTVMAISAVKSRGHMRVMTEQDCWLISCVSIP